VDDGGTERVKISECRGRDACLVRSLQIPCANLVTKARKIYAGTGEQDSCLCGRCEQREIACMREDASSAADLDNAQRAIGLVRGLGFRTDDGITLLMRGDDTVVLYAAAGRRRLRLLRDSKRQFQFMVSLYRQKRELWSMVRDYWLERSGRGWFIRVPAVRDCHVPGYGSDEYWTLIRAYSYGASSGLSGSEVRRAEQLLNIDLSWDTGTVRSEVPSVLCDLQHLRKINERALARLAVASMDVWRVLMALAVMCGRTDNPVQRALQRCDRFEVPELELDMPIDC